jgi:tetratricopeptide (TPR) repeat protein
MHAQQDAALAAFELAAANARQAGLPHELFGWRAVCQFYGSTPVSRVLAWLDENEPHEGRDYLFRGIRAGALARLGRFRDAREILTKTRAELTERGAESLLAALTGILAIEVELLAGDPAAAAGFGAEGCRLLEELRERAVLSSAAGMLAMALYELDRLEEADVWAGRAKKLGASDDVMTQLLWRQVRAKVLARRGEHAEAHRLARDAVTIGDATDYLDGQGDAYANLAEVLLLAAMPDEAVAALQQALERYERKGNVVSTQRAQTRLTVLQGGAAR